jgi:hypothetical protein
MQLSKHFSFANSTELKFRTLLTEGGANSLQLTRV